MVIAPPASAFAGRLVFTGRTITLNNWSRDRIATEGDRIVQHDGHTVIGYDCSESGDGTFDTLEEELQ